MALADVLDTRPALRPPIDRAREGSGHGAVLSDVVSVLVREHEVAAGAVGGRGGVAAEDDPVFAAEVTGLGFEAAVEPELERGVELDRQQVHLGAVDEGRDRVRDRLRVGGIALLLTVGADVDGDRSAAAVGQHVAPARGRRRDAAPRRRPGPRGQHRAAAPPGAARRRRPAAPRAGSHPRRPGPRGEGSWLCPRAPLPGACSRSGTRSYLVGGGRQRGRERPARQPHAAAGRGTGPARAAPRPAHPVRREVEQGLPGIGPDPTVGG